MLVNQKVSFRSTLYPKTKGRAMRSVGQKRYTDGDVHPIREAALIPKSSDSQGDPMKRCDGGASAASPLTDTTLLSNSGSLILTILS